MNIYIILRIFERYTLFDINNGTITLKDSDKDQSDLLVKILNFRKEVKPKNPEKKQKKEDVLENLYSLF